MGGGVGSSWGTTQGNVEMGLANQRWARAATLLRNIKERKQKTGKTEAELFATSGVRESREFVPEGFKSSAQILREFDLARAEAGQEQAMQLQAGGGRSPGPFAPGTVNVEGVKSEAELMSDRYGHVYATPRRAPAVVGRWGRRQQQAGGGLTAEQERERDLMARFRGEQITGAGATTESVLEQRGGDAGDYWVESKRKKVRLIGTGQTVGTDVTQRRWSSQMPIGLG